MSVFSRMVVPSPNRLRPINVHKHQSGKGVGSRFVAGDSLSDAIEAQDPQPSGA